MSGERAVAIELRHVTRRFGSLVAVRDLSLQLRPGRLHALIGENGAGKSTALKMMAGLLEPSEGELFVHGVPLSPCTPHEAMRRGVGMVHQHFMLVERLTALDNLMLGNEPCRGLRLDVTAARARGEEVAAAAGLAVDLDARVDDLSVGQRQRLEIVRVLFRDARTLLLDEPTAVLSPLEAVDLYVTLKRLAEGGATVCVVTHRLDEVVRFCDEVSVMRRGALVHEETLVARSERGDEGALAAVQRRLTTAIMGSEPGAPASAPERDDSAEIALEVRGLRVDGRGRAAVDALDLCVRAGEIVGVAGVEGNGQRELARALAGLLPLAAGQVLVRGRMVHAAGPARASGWRRWLGPRWDVAGAVRAARRGGLVVVHEDRHEDELVLDASVHDNLVLGDLVRGDLRGAGESGTVARRFARFDVYPPEPSRPARALSGGNQQKVVLGRALDRQPRALVLAQPTRGVDVGTARDIHHAIVEAAAAGAAVLLLSADLHELRSLCHRIVVLRRGRVVRELEPHAASDEAIGRAMLGLEEAS